MPRKIVRVGARATPWFLKESVGPITAATGGDRPPGFPPSREPPPIGPLDTGAPASSSLTSAAEGRRGPAFGIGSVNVKHASVLRSVVGGRQTCRDADCVAGPTFDGQAVAFDDQRAREDIVHFVVRVTISPSRGPEFPDAHGQLRPAGRGCGQDRPAVGHGGWAAWRSLAGWQRPTSNECRPVPIIHSPRHPLASGHGSLSWTDQPVCLWTALPCTSSTEIASTARRQHAEPYLLVKHWRMRGCSGCLAEIRPGCRGLSAARW